MDTCAAAPALAQGYRIWRMSRAEPPLRHRHGRACPGHPRLAGRPEV